MRIINGSLSGRRPILPSNLRVRPTTDRARESLFNILRHRLDFDSIRVLDLFAGTGCISFEFASMGAPEIWAVERDKVHCRAIIDNTRHLGITTLKVIQYEVFSFLKTKPSTAFDLIFADPPFDHPMIMELPATVINSGWFQSGGTFILEHGSRQEFSSYQHFEEMRHYGKVHFSFFRINNF